MNNLNERIIAIDMILKGKLLIRSVNVESSSYRSAMPLHSIAHSSLKDELPKISATILAP